MDKSNRIEIEAPRIGSLASRAPAEDYILDPDLANAVKVALLLGQPLLITGEPGTGKTKLADKVAADLAAMPGSDFLPSPLRFDAKTGSAATDLFYTYDALAHFHAAGARRESQGPSPEALEFVSLQALGKAIALTLPPGDARRELLGKDQPKAAHSSVVIIDEVDKAPRDFPNDILGEIENYAFSIREAKGEFSLRRDPARKIFVLLTSNSEKNLPDAFLRRCVFYHIPFPSPEKLLAIAKSHLGQSPIGERNLEAAVRLFIDKLRAICQRKKPATAEMVAWLRLLELHPFFKDNPLAPAQLSDQAKAALRLSLPALAKNVDDMKALQEFLR